MAKQLTLDEVNNKLKQNGLIVHSYKSTLTPITLQCRICNYQWTAIPKNYIYSNRLCPNCSVSKDIYYVYIASCEFGTKIGMSNKPSKRIRDLSSRSRIKFELVCAYPIGIKDKTKAVEAMAHSYFWNKKSDCPKTVDGFSEIFSISIEEARKVVEIVMDLL